MIIIYGYYESHENTHDCNQPQSLHRDMHDWFKSYIHVRTNFYFADFVAHAKDDETQVLLLEPRQLARSRRGKVPTVSLGVCFSDTSPRRVTVKTIVDQEYQLIVPDHPESAYLIMATNSQYQDSVIWGQLSPDSMPVMVFRPAILLRISEQIS